MDTKLHKDFKTYTSTEYYYYVDEPVYASYKTVMEPTYCDGCGQEDGAREVEVGVDFQGYKKRKCKKDTMYYMSEASDKFMKERVQDWILQPMLAERLMKGKK